MTDRLIGLMVVRDEADRYLTSSLAALSEIADNVVVFDDGSTDDTVNIAEAAGALVLRRQDHTPPFVEDEAAVRETAWRAASTLLVLDDTDLVLCVDADEFVVSDQGPVREELRTAAIYARELGFTAVTFPVAEVWGIEGDGTPQIRIDGQWALITATRLAWWKPTLTFLRLKLAGGSLPAIHRGRDHRTSNVTVLHYGYAKHIDRTVKHDRYTRLPGHSSAHVRSILEPPMTMRYLGSSFPMIGAS